MGKKPFIQTDKPHCSICKHRGFNQIESDFKPTFKCNQCGYRWAYGYNGGIYMDKIQNPGMIHKIPVRQMEGYFIYRIDPNAKFD